VLFPQRFWAGLADGSITLAFRRWRGARVRPGGCYRTPAGMLQVDAVEQVNPSRIDEREAHLAGYVSLAELLREMDRHGDGPAWRISFHHAGPDPRVALRASHDLDADEWARLRGRLARIDAASRRGPWTVRVLRLIDQHPGARAGDLAALEGRERLAFKADVRKLKELGLTESLEVGYRLSPRGRVLLERLRQEPPA
jgi:hypothetical protein